MIKGGAVRRSSGATAVLAVGLFLIFMAVPSGAVADAAQGQAIASAAQAMQNHGYPYCYGGGSISGPTPGFTDPYPDAGYPSDCRTTPGKVGFDCTGLTLYAVYQATGNAGLRHDGYQPGSGGGQVIANESDLQPGDVVYFDKTSNTRGLAYVDHAGIYVGQSNGQPMVLSAVSEKWGIRTESIPWYAAGGLRFVGAVRYWNGTGGRQPDGSLIRTPNGNVYRIAGGAPLHISRCDYTNGCAGVVAVPDLSAVFPVPRNGALLRNVDNGFIYEVVGGAPLHLGTCAYTECGQAVNVDGYPINALDHLNAVPSNGSLIRDGDNGFIYEVVGGAPLHLGTCAYTECGQAVNVDGYPINALDHLNAVPSNGSLIRDGDNGFIYEVVGGAPLHLGTCAYTECGQAVNVDGYPINALDHLNAVPSNGSFIRNGNTGVQYRIAGGAALGVTDCAALGGCSGEVTVDSFPLNALDHLGAVPADGTVLIGRPSGSEWIINHGVKAPTNSAASGVAINDATLATISTWSPLGGPSPSGPSAPPVH